MLSAKLARRARPPLGVCQPQGLVFPFTSVVERMTSLFGSLMEALGAPAQASSSEASVASTRLARMRDATDFMSAFLPLTRCRRPARSAAEARRVYGRRAASVKARLVFRPGPRPADP